MKHKHKFLKTLAMVLLIIGGITWGLIGVFDWDLLGTIFGMMSPLTRIIYVLIGLAAIYEICKGLSCSSSKHK